MTQDNGAFRTVSRIFAILRLLSKKSHGLSFTEMMNEFADIPKSSMHNLLKQMASHGMCITTMQQSSIRLGAA
ncbi:helix-turn-helix domain-containing protein [Paenibacillus naphthalenovorans]|uniref:helix-turn-helix domain-containing protein n=1 Tax=Paenibacillus naphthalenovorans TaxID=162209 RepID=UPI003D2D5FCE